MRRLHRAQDVGSPHGFDFTRHIRALCRDMVARLGELSHVDMDRVAVGFSQARHGGRQGIFATLTPLRFENGAVCTLRRGRTWGVSRLYDDAGREMLYILRFYLPRYLDLPLAQKLSTVAHELWHIGPRFDGDLRRFDGRCYAHSASKKDFDALAEQLAHRWLAAQPPPELHEFLHSDFRELLARYGRVYGVRVATPKLRPLKP